MVTPVFSNTYNWLVTAIWQKKVTKNQNSYVRPLDYLGSPLPRFEVRCGARVILDVNINVLWPCIGRNSGIDCWISCHHMVYNSLLSNRVEIPNSPSHDKFESIPAPRPLRLPSARALLNLLILLDIWTQKVILWITSFVLQKNNLNTWNMSYTTIFSTSTSLSDKRIIRYF